MKVAWVALGAALAPAALAAQSRDFGSCLQRVRKLDSLGRQAAGDVCTLMCGLCSSWELGAFWEGRDAVCTGDVLSCQSLPDADTAAAHAYDALTGMTSMQGYYWLDDAADSPEAGAPECMTALLRHAPRRDLLRLFSDPFGVADFLVENVRYALRARNAHGFLSADVDWEQFVDAVLPYQVLNEKPDLYFRWRPRFWQLFSPLLASENVTSIDAAVHAVVAAVPEAAAMGVLSLDGGDSAGDVVTWHSSTAPAYFSVQQVVQNGGSCTGTAVVLVAALRSVGLPARIAGCSESVDDDDHHWVEYHDPSDPGPFGDYWHTKEGVSAGNAGGPWDAPSGPMTTCLQHVTPGSELRTMWASSLTSETFLPTLWSNSTAAEAWSFVGGVNRCGAYCTAWGCGANLTETWSQEECFPAP